MMNPLAGLTQGLTRTPEAPKPVAASPQDPDEDLVTLVKRRFEVARSAKQSKLKTWATCLAFYVGEHYRNWSSEQRRMVQPAKIPAWRIMIADNQIPSILETVAAKLVRARQLPIALSNTTDEDDEAAAHAGTLLLSSWWQSHGMFGKELIANVQRILFGASFFHRYWDPYKTAQIAVPDPITGKMTVRTAPVGDICCEVLSVFDVFPDPQESWDDIGWCIIARKKPKSWFKDTFDVDLTEASESNLVFDTLLPETITATTQNTQGLPQDKSVTLYVYYEKPTKAHPKGRTAFVAGEKLLYSGDLPLPDVKIPLSLFAFRYVPKTLWPAGLIENILDHQRYLNASMNALLHILRFFAFPKWLVPREARVPDGSFSTQPNEMVPYDGLAGVNAPVAISPPAVPNWVQQFPQMMRSSMGEVVGVHEVSRAQAPAGVRSGVAIQLLQEQDDTKWGLVSALGKIGLEDLAKGVLTTAVAWWQEPRMVRQLGRGRTKEATALLASEIGDRDVLVDITEGVVDTKAAKQQRIQDYMNGQLFNPTVYPIPVRNAIIRALDEPWLAEALKPADDEMAQQQAQMAEQPNPEAEAMQAETEMAQQEHQMKMLEGQQKMQLSQAKVEQTRQLGEIKLQQAQQQMMLEQQRAEQQLAISQAQAGQQMRQQAVAGQQDLAMQAEKNRAALAMQKQQAKARATQAKKPQPVGAGGSK